jgi:hypothetical protein
MSPNPATYVDFISYKLFMGRDSCTRYQYIVCDTEQSSSQCNDPLKPGMGHALNTTCTVSMTLERNNA